MSSVFKTIVISISSVLIYGGIHDKFSTLLTQYWYASVILGILGILYIDRIIGGAS